MAEFCTSITIKGTNDELFALLKVLRIFVVDKLEQYKSNHNCGYLCYPDLLIANEEGTYVKFHGEECLDEAERLTDDYLLSVVEHAKSCIKIEADGPYGVFGLLKEVDLFESMVNAAPLSYINGRMWGFSVGGDDSLSVNLKDGLCKWNGGSKVLVAEKRNSQTININGWTVNKSKDAWTLVGFNIVNKIIDIPATIEGKPVTKIAKEAFLGIEGKSVKKIIIPKTITKIEKGAFGEMSNSDVEDMDPFDGCNDELLDTLEAIEVDDANPEYCSLSGILLDKAKTKIVYCPIRVKGKIEIPSSVKKIGIGQFASRRKITEIILNNGLENIGAFAFSRCQFKRITIPGSVKKIGKYAFMESDIETVVIEAGVKRLEAAFWLSALKEIHIPASVNYISKEAFGFVCGEDYYDSDFIGCNIEIFDAPADSYASKYYSKLTNGSLIEELKEITSW